MKYPTPATDRVINHVIRHPIEQIFVVQLKMFSRLRPSGLLPPSQTSCPHRRRSFISAPLEAAKCFSQLSFTLEENRQVRKATAALVFSTYQDVWRLW